MFLRSYREHRGLLESFVAIAQVRGWQIRFHRVIAAASFGTRLYKRRMRPGSGRVI